MNIIGKSDEVFLRLGVEEMDEPRLKAEPHRRVAGAESFSFCSAVSGSVWPMMVTE